MNSGMSWQDLLALVTNATGETIYMVVIATFFTVLIGLPLAAICLVLLREGSQAYFASHFYQRK